MSILEFIRTRPEFPAGDSEAARHEQAAYWIAMLESDRCRPAQKKSFLLWLEADPQNTEVYDRLRQTLYEADKLRDDADLVALRAEALGQGVNSRRMARRSLRVGAVAAVMVMGALAIGLAPNLLDRVSEGEPLQTAALDGQTQFHMTTEIGERLSRTLPDGSTIDMNTDSELRIDLSSERRDIYLLRGQAVFDVAHDENRPFIVYAGGRKVTALGTLFEVRMEDFSTQVTLLEGRVRVDEVAIGDESNPDDGVRPEPIAELSPGERYLSAENESMAVSEQVIESDLSWLEGRHRFRDAPVSEMVFEINRYTTRTVILKDPAIGELVASANFKLGSTKSLAVALETNFGLSVTDDPANDHILVDW